MRGIKLTVAIVTIILGVISLLGGIALIVLGAFVSGFISGLYGSGTAGLLAGAIAGAVAAVLIILGIVVLLFGVLYLTLGIKFTSRKPNQGIAITLLIFYGLGAIVSFYDVIVDGGLELLASGIIMSILVALLIVYLAKLKNMPPPPVQHQQFQSNDPWGMNQPQSFSHQPQDPWGNPQ